jgi:hypothetical protein
MSTRVMTSTKVRKCDQSWDILPESYHLTGVVRTIGVRHTTGVASSDWSQVFRPEMCI